MTKSTNISLPSFSETFGSIVNEQSPSRISTTPPHVIYREPEVQPCLPLRAVRYISHPVEFHGQPFKKKPHLKKCFFSKPKKSHSRLLPDSAIDVLKEWFCSHIHNPYPTEDEKAILRKKTGLSQTQLRNWMSNARRRYLVADREKVPEVYYIPALQQPTIVYKPVAVRPNETYKSTVYRHWPLVN